MVNNMTRLSDEQIRAYASKQRMNHSQEYDDMVKKQIEKSMYTHPKPMIRIPKLAAAMIALVLIFGGVGSLTLGSMGGSSAPPPEEGQDIVVDSQTSEDTEQVANGIEIEDHTEDIHVEPNAQLVVVEPTNYEFEADLTHDGIKEKVCVTVQVEMPEYYPIIMVTVIQNGKKLYEQEMYCHVIHGTACYLVNVDGEDYLMNYHPLVAQDTASCWYSVFSLSKDGEPMVLEEQSIEIYFYDIDTLDKEAWIEFAEAENKYFENGFLVVSTLDGALANGTTEPVTTYKENYEWLYSVQYQSKIVELEEAIAIMEEEVRAEYFND